MKFIPTRSRDAAWDADDFAIQCDAPAIWLRQTARIRISVDLPAPLARQGHALAGPQKEGNAFQRTDAAIGLGDIFNIQKRGRDGVPCGCGFSSANIPTSLLHYLPTASGGP